MGGSTYHTPVLLEAVVDLFRGAPAGAVVDATLGGGGHSAALLEADAQRTVIGVDRDPDALAAARKRLPADRAELVHGNFADLPALLGHRDDDPPRVAGILLDLGVSSWQLDAAQRGFAFKHDNAPLDMRMDPSADDQPSAAEFLDDLGDDEAALARVLREFGEVRDARRTARAILEARAAGSLQTTGDLARCVESISRAPKGGRGARRVHPATRVFQALRIAVNRELEALDKALVDAPALLIDGGRMVVISYHSLEDRRVKQAFRQGEQGPARPSKLPPPSDWRPTWQVLTNKPISALADEVEANPRARSARLRAAARAPRRADEVSA